MSDIELYATQNAGETILVETWEATMRLRVVIPITSFGFMGGIDDRRLQQSWRCRETGAVEWRDVETVNVSREKLGK